MKKKEPHFPTFPKSVFLTSLSANISQNFVWKCSLRNSFWCIKCKYTAHLCSMRWKYSLSATIDTHTHTPGGATWPASQQNVPPLTMLPTFPSLACGDNAVCSVISRRVLANLSGVFNQKCNHLQMYYESVFIY